MTQTLSNAHRCRDKEKLRCALKTLQALQSFLAAEAIKLTLSPKSGSLTSFKSESPNWTQDKKSVMKEYRNGSTHGVGQVKQKYRDEGCLLPRAIR